MAAVAQTAQIPRVASPNNALTKQFNPRAVPSPWRLPPFVLCHLPLTICYRPLSPYLPFVPSVLRPRKQIGFSSASGHASALRNKRRKLIAVVVVALAALVACFLVFQNREPTWQGRTLGAWLRDFDADKPEIRARTANAIPVSVVSYVVSFTLRPQRHPCKHSMVRDRGFEPLTPSVSRKCSTTELTAQPIDFK